MQVTKENLVEHLINKMLEKHKVTYKQIRAKQVINGEPWYNYYKWTKQESQDFKKYAIGVIKNTNRTTQKRAEELYSYFYCNYGLQEI